MAYTYTRQSTFSDGDTITAAVFNNEYNQLLNAFAYSSSDAAATGHRHDGTAAQGGSIYRVGDLDFLNKIEADSTNNRWGFYVQVSSSAVEQIRIQDGAIVPVTDSDIDLGTGSLEFKDLYIDGTAYLDAINFNGTAISSTAAELNILDGVTSTASELNILDGVTSTAAELNILDGVTSTAAELNILDGVTSTAAELNILDGVTASSADINLIDGITNGTVIASKAIITDANKDISGGRNITISGELDAATLDISGDADIDGTLEADAITIAGVTLAETISDTVGAMVSSNSETGISVTYEDSDNTLDFVIGSGVIVSSMLDTDIDISGVATASTFEPDGDTASGDNAAIGYTGAEGLILTGQGSTNDVTIKNDADTAVISIPTGTTNVTIAGDLTISGDDLVMGTNTAGHILVADGTNFNPVAVGDLSEISTVASDDVFLAVDTSGGGLKRITRSTLTAGFASSSAISNLSEDSSPQLGGDLDVDGNGLVSTSNGNIALTPNGSGVVRIDGNVDIQTGEIILKNGGSVSNIKFYCESSNAHYAQLQSAPHSAYSGNITLTLPAATDTLVGKATTDTLTNKTLTSPVLNTGTVGTSLVPASADGATLGTAAAEFSDLYLADAGVVFFGNDQEVKLIHNADKGLILKHTATADDKPVSLTLQTGETDIAANDVIGTLDFQAPDEGTGTDAVLVAAGISAVSEGDFSSSANATKLSFKTAASEAAAEKMSLSSGGNLTVSGNVIAVDLDISGDVDIDGTLEADAITVNGTTLAETISDTVGAMVGSNTETGITVAYQDGDNTLDFALGAAQTTITSLLAADIKIGEDDQTKVDFGTANEIHLYADNTKRVTVDSTGLTINSGSLETATIDYTDGDNALTIADGGGITAAAGITSTAAANAFGASSVTGALQLKNGATSAGFVEFFEDSDNGTNKVTLIGPASTADITLTLPSTDGDADQFLQTNGSGVMSWATAGGAYTAWAVKTGNYTASASDQLVCNHASTAFTITLPAGSANDTVVIANAGAALITVARNGSQKINSVAENGTISQGRSTQLVYIDDTIGWFEV